MDNFCFPSVESLPFALKSITWTKPGIIEIRISKIGLIQDLKTIESTVPSTSEYTPWNVPLLEKTVKMSDITCEVIWRFVYGEEIAPSGTDRSPSGLHSEQWAMRCVFRDEELINHPNIVDILEKYKGYVQGGRVYFNRYIIIDDPAAKGTKKQVKNPYYGVRSYFSPSVELSMQKFNPLPLGGLHFDDFDAVGYSIYEGEEQNPKVSPGAAKNAPNSTPSKTSIPQGSDTGFAFLGNLGEGMAEKQKYPWLLVSRNARKSTPDCVREWTWRYERRGWQGQLYDNKFVFAKPWAIKV